MRFALSNRIENLRWLEQECPFTAGVPKRVRLLSDGFPTIVSGRHGLAGAQASDNGAEIADAPPF